MTDKPFSYILLEVQKLNIDTLLERLDQQYRILAEKEIEPADKLAAKIALGDAQTVAKQCQMDNPKRKALLRYIEDLDETTAKKMASVMYFGRGDDDTFEKIYETTKHWTADACRLALGEKKTCLHEYLFKGQLKLRQQGVDIDKI